MRHQLGACEPGLRHRMLRGGVFLSARQVLTALLGFGASTAAVAWLGIGPYGLFAGALGLIGPCTSLCQLGIGAYLLRHPDEHDEAAYHQAFTLLGLVGLVVAALGMAVLPQVSLWMGVSEFETVASAMLTALPLTLVSRVPQCRLERRLEYRSVAAVELSATLLRHGSGLGLMVAGCGLWGLVAGWWFQQAMLLAGGLWASRYRPRWIWRIALLRPMLDFGLGIWSAKGVLSLRGLVNPLVVGRLAGSEAMGQVALAISLCEAAAMLQAVALRLSAGLFGAIQGDKARVARAISEGTTIQIWLTGPALLVIACAGSVGLPALFGAAWVPVMHLFPYLALGCLVTGLTQLQVSALFTLGKARSLLWLNVLHMAMFVSAAGILVPKMGLTGYGVADVLASGSVLILLWKAEGFFGRLCLGFSVASAAAFALALFVPLLGPVAALGLVFLFSFPQSWRDLKSFALRIWGGRGSA